MYIKVLSSSLQSMHPLTAIYKLYKHDKIIIDVSDWKR